MTSEIASRNACTRASPSGGRASSALAPMPDAADRDEPAEVARARPARRTRAPSRPAPAGSRCGPAPRPSAPLRARRGSRCASAPLRARRRRRRAAAASTSSIRSSRSLQPAERLAGDTRGRGRARIAAAERDARAAARTTSIFATDVSPTPRRGVLTMRFHDTSSSGFTSARRYASASLISRRS